MRSEYWFIAAGEQPPHYQGRPMDVAEGGKYRVAVWPPFTEEERGQAERGLAQAQTWEEANAVLMPLRGGGE